MTTLSTPPDLLTLAGLPLRRIAATAGGEHAGPCPKCGGRDRLHIQPQTGRWMCRSCHPAWGDAIDFIRWRDGCSFADARALLGMPPRAAPAAPPPSDPPDPSRPPPEAWQALGGRFVDWCARRLWRASCPAAAAQLAYLERRGLRYETILAADLGFHPTPRDRSRADWGLAPTTTRWPDRLYLRAGIVIPWYADGALWRINVRQDTDDPADRYREIAGGVNALYGADDLCPGWPAVVVEGELDALSIRQAAGDMITAVATGGTTRGRGAHWLARLAVCPAVLVAFDGEPRGEAASAYWLDVLRHNARRWRPLLKDANAMLAAGMDVRGWIAAGLEAAHVAD